jgi:hypothetical protein
VSVSLLSKICSCAFLLVVLNAGNFREKEPKGKLSPEEEVRILRRQIEVIDDEIFHVLSS